MKLYLMQLATLQPDDIPVPAYLVQTDEGKNILIDSGFPESFAGKVVELPGGRTVEMSAENFIVKRLGSIGLRPENIDMVVCTHLDADHAGGHAAFPNAEFIVQRTHYETAHESEHPRFAALRDEWDRPSLRYRFVEGDIELVPGIELIETSGHVPGHQAVLVRLPDTGTVLLAIDAIPHSSMLDADTRWVMPIDMDEKDTRQSTRKLVEIAKRENVKLFVHGHDAEQWKTLKHAPEFYS
jgi:N-acyl homoserine lactone hydrolase